MSKALTLATELLPILEQEFDKDIRITSLKMLVTLFESEKVNLLQEEMLRKAFASSGETLLNS